MRFEIEKTEETPDDVPVKLSWEKRADGSVSLMGRREWDTCPYHLILFNTDGTITRIKCIPTRLGFQLDERERIVVSDDE